MPKRFLCDLKVAELRNELEKRGVDKSGVKPILMERLREVLLCNPTYFQIILKEGYDPATFNFKNASNPGVGPPGDGLRVKVETSDVEAAIAELDNSGRPESHLTSVSEGSIGAAEASEIDDKAKEDANEQSEDATTFVVRVGENEDDLDYDIKDASASAEERQKETKMSPSAKNVDSEASTTTKQIYPEKQLGKLQSSKTSITSEQAYLRVSNLKMPTKAVDLKQFFSSHGKVVSGKILASTRAPGGCVGFLKMASAEDAAACIKKLDGTEFNGKIIKIEATDKVPSSISKAPKKESSSGPDKIKPVGTPAPSKSSRFRGGDVGSRAVVSSRSIESGGGVGSASPNGRLHRRSARNILGRYRKSALINSHFTRSLQRAQNFMHHAGGSVTVSARSFRVRQNRRRISDEAEAVGSDPKRSRFKIPCPRVHYYESLPAFTQYNSSRTRCDEHSEREAPHDHRCRGTRESYPVRTRRDESYSVHSADVYYRRGSRFASPQEEIPSRHYAKPVVYRRPPTDRFDVPVGYVGDGGGSIVVAPMTLDPVSLMRTIDNNPERVVASTSPTKIATESTKTITFCIQVDIQMIENPFGKKTPDPSTSHRHRSRDRSRSPPPSRASGVSRSRSPPPLPPPIHYTRRSPPPPSSSLASHKHRPNYETSSASSYSRRAGGGDTHQSYPQASGSMPSSSRISQKVSHIIDYGHRSSANKSIPSWQSSSRSQNFDASGFSSGGAVGGSRGGGSGYSSTQWRSSGYSSRQQTRY
ncbi:Scaffold attachment factor B2 [Echinococcus granulosus]|uniref:Scaffold attachment factor B2 n=1 Tax=Echinococcus granulosus TaxID=6210 RepID=W6UPV0_ECHGR|nr:Scaffold attachment factor B2 [Echinococcus granulosus]EUB55429.1 Scaffold attachment factor B2 [Echinococcus granulosus]